MNHHAYGLSLGSSTWSFISPGEIRKRKYGWNSSHAQRCLQGEKQVIKSIAQCLRSTIVPNTGRSCLGVGCPEQGRGGRNLMPRCARHCGRPFVHCNLLSPLKHFSELGYHLHLPKEEIENQEGM